MLPNPEKAFLGIGWAFPVSLEVDDTFATAAYEEDVRQAILIILGTNPGERVMRPTFGAGLRDFIFEPLSVATLALIEDRVRSSLIRWEARIDLEEVTVRAEQPSLGKLEITIRYRVRATNAQFNLVYPFYLQEGTAQ